MDASRFRRQIQAFHVRLTKASRSFRAGDINLECQRNSALAEYGFTKNRSTIFLDAVSRRRPDNICAIMGYIGREHMRLPMVLDAYYRYVSNAIGSLLNLTGKSTNLSVSSTETSILLRFTTPESSVSLSGRNIGTNQWEL
jgi:hypothetical protein